MKPHKMLTFAPVALMLSGCAAIMSGESQDIRVVSEPPGARCEVMRDGELLGTVARTPGQIVIKRTGDDLTVNCTSETGKGHATNESGLNSWFLGNALGLLPGLLVGGLIDSVSAAHHAYDSETTVELRPVPQPKQATR